MLGVMMGEKELILQYEKVLDSVGIAAGCFC
jgi:hypothetical protein